MAIKDIIPQPLKNMADIAILTADQRVPVVELVSQLRRQQIPLTSGTLNVVRIEAHEVKVLEREVSATEVILQTRRRTNIHLRPDDQGVKVLPAIVRKQRVLGGDKTTARTGLTDVYILPSHEVAVELLRKEQDGSPFKVCTALVRETRGETLNNLHVTLREARAEHPKEAVFNFPRTNVNGEPETDSDNNPVWDTVTISNLEDISQQGGKWGYGSDGGKGHLFIQKPDGSQLIIKHVRKSLRQDDSVAIVVPEKPIKSFIASPVLGPGLATLEAGIRVRGPHGFNRIYSPPAVDVEGNVVPARIPLGGVATPQKEIDREHVMLVHPNIGDDTAVMTTYMTSPDLDAAYSARITALTMLPMALPRSINDPNPAIIPNGLSRLPKSRGPDQAHGSIEATIDTIAAISVAEAMGRIGLAGLDQKEASATFAQAIISLAPHVMQLLAGQSAVDAAVIDTVDISLRVIDHPDWTPASREGLLALEKMAAMGDIAVRASELWRQRTDDVPSLEAISLLLHGGVVANLVSSKPANNSQK